MRVREYEPEVIYGALVEGAFVALLAASELRCDFAYANRLAGDPKQLFSVDYRLPGALHPVVKGKRLVVMNDVISTGSAVRGTIKDLRQHGGNVVAVASLVVLSDTFIEFCQTQGLPLISLFRREANMWTPDACPLCASGSIPEYLAHN